ncbi:ABC transporter substrate-binding protein [Pelagibius litoralis]|uniref:ABC transporter substrate-binding protein n=1 Tax=Pelagibius litoralis TaxID=374515 RepID=A0A967EY53_9PROT|nr:ABC transporter substrate-binding protein [Pelagibius litoralis]NIA69557.1 ABC transporter substrate-binding protein [Pelagibius litoralis]
MKPSTALLAVAILALVSLGRVPAFAQGAPGQAPGEPPVLRFNLATGALPPLAERLPEEPRRDLPALEGWREGRYGGSLRLLSRAGRDARDLMLLGYARLVVWNENFELVPDILKTVSVEDGRIFTLTLRAGHRWSDGTPFTTADFRFWWEDVANNAELSPSGLPPEMLADGRPPVFEVLDDTTVRFTWATANPLFLPALAGASPLLIYRPRHYLERFHAGYADSKALAAQAETMGLQSWAELFQRRDRLFRFDNPDLPSLQPWVNTVAPPAERFVARRNPYFHRVDGAGRQLPYIDEVILTPTQPGLIAAKAAAGEADLLARGLSYIDAPVLKAAEERGKIKLRLWPIGRGAQLALYPNLNVVSPGWRKALRDVRFRRALSLAVDRDELNQVLYQGTALPGANTLLPASPLYAEADRKAWAVYDPDQANALLDEMGMLWRDKDGIRHLPDGRRADLVIETADTDPAEVDALEVITEQWRKVGIAVLIRSQGRQAARQRIRAGATNMSIFYGLTNGLATAAMSPAELAPTSDRQNNWPLWGLHFQSNGEAGEAPDLPAAQELLALYEAWASGPEEAAQAKIWQRMLQIHADQVFTIGLLGAVRQPVVVNADLRNLPAEAVYLYDPGAYFGRYRPDTFWFAQRLK